MARIALLAFIVYALTLVSSAVASPSPVVIGALEKRTPSRRADAPLLVPTCGACGACTHDGCTGCTNCSF
ncbi:hypothetical protein PHLGIDRAFT_32493 [Phlebiopsis gigantea 11061_1 CR5-6]|uniref:Uncharacterized protein n=1 Tax=Phlebiopsis gigantea (strain 11061_1 CR5-6) TaxID=745531 RepID=A0A0C3PA19_PHLG1|nr:hypothetical protein PHLGIDRAFT_32493 [Phlebiopsis gigantea 11061_1 CR5-6]